MPNILQRFRKNSTSTKAKRLSSAPDSEPSHLSVGSGAGSSGSLLKEVRNQPAPLPADEDARLQKLLDYQVLDTDAETRFDELTELASAICGTPIALVSLIDRDRQWFKSRVGLPAPQTSRDAAFCTYTILNKDKVMVVPNALGDDRFKHNELVLGSPNIRFYAGAPLVTPDGFALGTICAIDTVPREFDEKKQRALQIISHQVVAQLEISKHVEELKVAIRDLQSTQQNLRQAKDYAELASISSFENLLLSTAGMQAFEAFLNQEFCAENLSFWREAREYREAFESRSAAENETAAREILTTYVLLNSVKQVNLSGECSKEIEGLISSGKIGKELFEEGRREAFTLMKKDSYTRFLNSSQYRELMLTVRHIGMVRLQAQGDFSS